MALFRMPKLRIVALVSLVSLACLPKLRELYQRSGELTTDVKGHPVPRTTPSSFKQFSAEIPTEPHVAFVVCGDRLPEAMTLLKSIAMFHDGPLRLHAFVERSLQQAFYHQWSKLREDASSLTAERASGWTLNLYEVELPRDVPKEIKNLFEPCASLRLFLSDLLTPSLNAVIYLDIDILVLSSLSLLWKELHSFKRSQIFGATRETEKPNTGWYPHHALHPYYRSTGLNTGVLLLRLDRMRDQNVAERLLKIHRQYKGSIQLGDQDLINIFANLTPESIYLLPCSFNFRWDHCRDRLACAAAAINGPQLLHGNRGFFHGAGMDTFEDMKKGSPKTGGRGDAAFTVIWKHFHRFRVAEGHLLNFYNPLVLELRSVSNTTSCARLYPLFLRPLHRRMRRDTTHR